MNVITIKIYINALANTKYYPLSIWNLKAGRFMVLLDAMALARVFC